MERERAARAARAACVVEVGYNANHFVNDWRSIDGNPAPAGPGRHQRRRRFTTAVVPGTGDVITLANVVAHPEGRLEPLPRAADEGREALLEGRVAARLLRLVAHARRSQQLSRTCNDIDAEVAPGGHDRTHHFVASGVYELPFGRDRASAAVGRRGQRVLGGWSVSPIVTIASGAPLNLTVNGNPSNTGQNDRPNVVGDWQLDNPTPERWFNTAAFVANAPLHVRQRAAEPAARPGHVQPRRRAAQVVQGDRPRHRRPALRVVQRHQHAGTSATPTRRSATRTSAASRRPARPAATRSR